MKSKISEHITIDELRELFEIRGSDVVWRTAPANNVKTNQVFGAIVHHHGNKYRCGGVSKSNIGCVHIKAHVIAYALTHNKYPATGVDHKDGNGLNNSPHNIRLATSSQNGWNKRLSKLSTTGIKGVNYRQGYIKPYYARVRAYGKVVFAEYFTTLEEATVAVQEARIKHHGEFARHA